MTTENTETTPAAEVKTPVVGQTLDQEGIESFQKFQAAHNAQETPPAKQQDAAKTDPDGEDGEEAEAGAEEAAKVGGETGSGDDAAPAKPEGELTKGQQKKANRAAAAARRAAEADAADAKAERDALRAENAKLKAAKEPAKEKAAPAVDKEPDPEAYEFGSLDPAYLKAVREFDKAELRKEMQAERQAEAAGARALEMEANREKQIDAILEERLDFYEVVVDGAREKKWACSDLVGQLIDESPVGQRVALHLADNPAESRRIAALPLTRQAVEFGKIEAKFETPAKGKPAAQNRISRADPPATVTRGSNGKFAANSANPDFAQFEKDFSHLLTPR